MCFVGLPIEQPDEHPTTRDLHQALQGCRTSRALR